MARCVALIVFGIIALFQSAVLAATGHTFLLDVSHWGDKPASVSVAGTFNGWSRDATPMTDPDGDLVYQATVELPDGVTLYKFVIDGQRWINDDTFSDKELEEGDGHGGRNSAVLIGPDARKIVPLPEAVHAGALRFDPTDTRDLNVYDGHARLRLRTLANDVDAVFAAIETPMGVSDGTALLAGQRALRMHRIGTQFGYDLWGGVIPVTDEGARFTFYFRDGAAEAELDAAGLRTTARDDEPFRAPARAAFVTPAWTHSAVWYQIFPERFRNGDRSNDPPNATRWTSKWFATLDGETPGDENFYRGAGNVWNRRYGGDIQGLRESLPYLRDLGVTAIYLNPIFEAESMHKYDTADFRHVDDNFGVKGDLPVAGETDDPSTWQWSASDKVFLDFVAEAHRQGFKVVLDGVFNHVGREHTLFQDVLKNGRNSKYADWFEITDWGDQTNWGRPDTVGKPGGIQYVAWDGPSGALPVFRKDPVLGLAPGPRAHVMAITRRWLAPDGDASRGIDGWRLDVANDIPHPFWRDWRKVVKETKPDAYIAGEIWSWAQPWIDGGDQFDAVMNYRFADAVQQFFVNRERAISPSEFGRRLDELVYHYPLQAALAMMNLFSSHDTDRFASMFVNPDLPYDGANRIQDNGPNYNPREPDATERQRQLQAVAFQMTFLGAPMIYYGDEAGMWAPDDPSNRMPMWWADLGAFDEPGYHFRPEIYAAYQRAIAVRRAAPALATGFYRTVKVDDARGILVFVRELDDQRVYVMLNRSDQEATIQVPVSEDGTYVDLMSPEQTMVAAPEGPTDRPVVKVRQGAQGFEAKGGVAGVPVPAYGVRVLRLDQ